MPATWDLAGHTALVTGAGKRLGRAFALGLAEAGSDVIVHYNRSQDAAEETASLVREQGVRAQTLQADLGDLSQVEGLLTRAKDRVGEVDFLVNSAAIFGAGGPDEMDERSWQRHLDINLRAPVFLIRELARQRGDRPAAAVNLLDWRALRPGTDHFSYTIAKAGLAAATRSLAQAYAPATRVNGLALGAILPPPGEEEKRSDLVERVPQDRWGDVEEVVESVLFLLGGPQYITGEILHLDGGRHLT